MTQININKVGNHVEVQGKRDQIITGKEKVNGNKVYTETIVCDLNHDNKQLAEKLQYDFSNYLKLAYPNSSVQFVSGLNGSPGATYQVVDSDFHLLPSKRQRKGEDKATFTFQSAECVGETEFKLIFNTQIGEMVNFTTTFQLFATGENTTTLVMTDCFQKPKLTVGRCASKVCTGALWIVLLGWYNVLTLRSCRDHNGKEKRKHQLIQGIHAFLVTAEYEKADKAIEPELVHPELVKAK